jgi:hypothetical protein
MTQQGSWLRLLGRALLAAGLLSGSGCLSFVHPVDPPLHDLVGSCQELPQCCRDHVYVFLIHGMDPLDLANLAGLNKYFRQLGFHQTYYGQLYHTGYFKKEIRRVHQEDPEARFVLVGFSFGANCVRSVAQAVKTDGVHIDLLVYLGGNTLDNIPEDKPENAVQIVNILASGCIWNGAWMDEAINIHETDVWHFGSPTHPRTLEVLTEELFAVASTVPVVDPPVYKGPVLQGEPTPRPVEAPTETRRDEWDFLKPVTHLPAAPPQNPQRPSIPAGALVGR